MVAFDVNKGNMVLKPLEVKCYSKYLVGPILGYYKQGLIELGLSQSGSIVYNLSHK